MRRAVGVERLQLKWLAYAAASVPAAVVLCIGESAIAGESGPVTDISVSLALLTIPTAVGVAVMRYRLYEIDRLINRTLVYAILSVGLAAVFAGVSLALGVAIGSGSTVPTAAATLAVAVAFGPLRSRVQVAVDRRFDRARYEGLRKVERFLEELRAGRAAPEATGEVLAEALQDPQLELLFWLPAEAVYVDASGRAVERSPAAGRARTPVRRGTLALGAVVHDAALAQRPDLLDSVIEAAGLAIEIARLRVEVRRRLADVEESRARIVSAGYEERRRLERDLHDGAQQRLVSIGLALRHVQAQVPATPRRISSTRWSTRSRRPSRSCASSREECGRPGSTTASRPRCASSRPDRPCRPGSRPPPSASTTGSRPPRTSWRARRSPTPPSTRAPRRWS